jgi:SAM-dependent methyltransferase/GNAT superfamily N-acetyltransferase
MDYMLMPAKEDDKQLIYGLKKDSIFQYVDEIWGWDEAYQVKDFNDNFVLGNFQVIMLDGLKIGFIETFDNENLINISEIQIEKNYRCNGIGSDIIKKLIDKACQQIKIITLGCFKKNAGAKSLYKKLGFDLKEETKTHFLLEYNPIRNTTKHHYDLLVDENNDPARDPKPLLKYMGKWDGQAFIDELQLSLDKTMLEIGVGTGRLALRVCGNCKSFTGIDISPQTITRAKENLREYENIKLICGNFLTYPFSESFEVIYSSLTFMHIKDKRAAIRKTADLLNTGGLFVLSVSKSQDRILEYGDRKIEIYPDTLEQIIALFADSGLTIEKQFETEFAVVFAARKGTESYET